MVLWLLNCFGRRKRDGHAANRIRASEWRMIVAIAIAIEFVKNY